MTISVGYSIVIIAVVAGVTWLTRAIPFVVFGRRQEVPKIVRYLGAALPTAMIAILVVYCLKAVNLTAYPFGLAELISVAVVVGVHLWKKNVLVSIACGTVCYMILIRTLFAV